MHKINRRRLIQTLQELVNIPSFENIDEISAYVQEILEEEGFTLDVDIDGNIVTSLGNGEGVLLNAHLDTVKATNWDFDPFKAKIEGNRLYGRGATDCKAGIASMIELSRVLSERDLTKRIVFVFTGYEEGYPHRKHEYCNLNGLTKTTESIVEIIQRI